MDVDDGDEDEDDAPEPNTLLAGWAKGQMCTQNTRFH